MPKATKSGNKNSGMLYVGSVMLGVGIAWLIDPKYIAPGAVVGVGIGFIILALARKS